MFYETRLHAGREALGAGKHLEAAENLRIACFGLLDYPVSLSPCLAMLAVAQNSLGRSEEVDGTLSRFVEVEKRFPSWDPAALDGTTRRSFDTILQARVPRSTLASLPRVAAALGMARPVEPRVSAVEVRPEPPVTRPPAEITIPNPIVVTPEKAAKVSSKPATTVPPVQKPAVTTTTTTTQKPPAAAQTKPPVTKPAATAARPSADPLSDARRLIADRRPAEAVKVLEAAVAQSPQRRDVRLALLQATVFASDWRKGVAQMRALLPFRDSEAAYTFYAAVALHESGSRTEARNLLVPVKSRLARSAWVDDYSKKILGAGN